jgi:competence protein ComEC
MGAGGVALLLWPFGLAGLPLAVAGWASAWILAVADRVAGLEGAVTTIPVPASWAIPALSLGALWLAIWPGLMRWAGLAPVVVALAAWGMADRPALLISDDGKLAGLLGPEGRALSAPKGAGFAAETWLQRDGDGASQRAAAGRPGFTGPPEARSFTLGPVAGVVLAGRDAGTRVAAACATARLVILPEVAAAAPEGCLVIDRRRLRDTGALAVTLTASGEIALTPARRRDRAWNRENRTDPARLAWRGD